MVYFENWQDYEKAVEDLYAAAPVRCRYLVKYRHCDGKLVLKVTDGPTCLKYRTERLPDLKKFERLNRILMDKMQQRKLAPPPNPTSPDPGVAAAVSVAASGPAPSSKRRGKKR
ncbi:signal recognition particle, SRP9/SRP14 subunit, partial [Cladochytrium replicatum]